MTPQPSPAGDIRNRSVPCLRCGAPTFNFSARCDDCWHDDRWDDAEGDPPDPWRPWEHEPDIAADRHVERGGA